MPLHYGSFFCLFVCLFSIIAVEIMNYFHLCVNSGDCYPCFFLVALFLLQVVSLHMGVHQHPAEKSRETLSESPDTSFSPLSSLSPSFFPPFPLCRSSLFVQLFPIQYFSLQILSTVSSQFLTSVS